MTAIIVLGVVAVVSNIVLLQVTRQHAAERKDMMDRLMSRNLLEYKELTAPTPEPSGPVSLTDEEEWMREIEQMKSGVII